MFTTHAGIFGGPLSTYTRTDALADGLLHTLDVHLAAEFGISVPVDITAAARARTITATSDACAGRDVAAGLQRGRSADILRALARRIRSIDPDTPITYGERLTIAWTPSPAPGITARGRIRLVAHFGHDGIRAVITLMEEDES